MSDMRKPPRFRQAQVTALRCQGMCPKEIARHLGLSEKTVWYHMDQTYLWLKHLRRDVALLTQWALKHGIAEWKV